MRTLESTITNLKIQMIMLTTRRITSWLLFTLIGVMGAFAQEEQKEEVSEEELKQFASAFQQVQVVSQEAQQEMVKAIEEEGLEVMRFNEIQQAQQDPNQEAEATGEELKKYEAATGELERIQVEAQRLMQERIAEEGLTVDRYQEIAAIIQGDPELQQKLQQYMQG